MKVKKIENNVYKKLLNYIFKYCDIISLEKYNDQHVEQSHKTMDIILSTGKYSLEQLSKNYSNKLLNQIYEEFKNNPYIFDEDYKKKYEHNKLDRNLKILNRKSVIEESVQLMIYDYLIKSYIDHYKNSIVFSKKTYINNFNYSNIYFIKLDNDIKEKILNLGLYDWCFPLHLENLTFYKKNICWLKSITHEEICEIYCSNKEEFEYLKSIGIEFYEKEYKPLSEDKLIKIDELI